MTNSNLNYFISAILTTITTCILAIFVISRNPKSPLYRTFFLYTISISAWAFPYAFLANAPTKQMGLFLGRAFNIGLSFISVGFLHFVLILLEVNKSKRRKIINPLYIIAIIFTILIPTKLMIRDVTPKFGLNYFINPGPAYYLYVLFWFGCVLYGLLKFFKGYRNAKGARRNQLKYLFFGTLVGFAACPANFALVFDIKYPFYPLATYVIPIYTAITAYAIIRYRLVDITIFAVRSLIFSVVYGVLLISPLIIFFNSKIFLTQALSGSNWWILPLSVGAYALLASLTPFIYLFLRRSTEDIILKEQRHYQNILRQLSATMTLIKEAERLPKIIVRKVSRAVKVEFACIYLADDDSGMFFQKSPYTIAGFFPNFPTKIPYLSKLIFYIKERRKPVFAEELTPTIKNEFGLKSGLIIPSFVKDRLLGFLLLGPKSSGAIYTPDDASVFEVLANQAALAIENAEFISESQETQAQLFAAERMTSMGAMAGGLSHQVNNRFHTIILAASDTIDILKLIDLEKASKEELKDYFSRIQHTLERIAENAEHGGKIVNNFINFAQPDRLQREAKEFDLREPLARAIEMVRIKTTLPEETIKKDIPDTLPQIQGDFVLLLDAFFNLIDNAYDAIKEKEKFIENGVLGSIKHYKGIIKISIAKLDSAIVIKIEDNGIGIKEINKNKVFSPFFTTKASSTKGTGMGLFVIQKIIAAHQGQIKLTSEYGQGAAFIITLPINKKGTKNHEP
jgi:signal transduction histidine kinase